MVYLLGSDVHAAITTEHDVIGISINENNGNVHLDNVLIAEVSSINASTDIITCAAAHGLSDGDPIMITMDADATVGMLPGTPAGGSTTYFVNAPDATTLSLHETYATGVTGSSKVDLADSEATTTNITRELSGANTSGTLIKNRSWPKYDGTGRKDTIIGDSTTPEGIEQTTAADLNTLTDLTGLDISIGTTDEDMSFFGQNTALKAELKNEVTVTFTRKKSDNKYSALFNKARAGVLSFTDTTKTALDVDSAGVIGSTLSAIGACEINNTLADGIGSKPSQNFGYRIHIMMKTGVEVLTLRNCCINSYTTTVNSDGVTEETLEFYGNVKPKVTNAAIGHITVTPVTDL